MYSASKQQRNIHTAGPPQARHSAGLQVLTPRGNDRLQMPVFNIDDAQSIPQRVFQTSVKSPTAQAIVIKDLFGPVIQEPPFSRQMSVNSGSTVQRTLTNQVYSS